MKENLLNEEFERCVLCGKLTDIPISLPVEFRNNYEIGVGQLCGICGAILNQADLDKGSMPYIRQNTTK